LQGLSTGSWLTLLKCVRLVSADICIKDFYIRLSLVSHSCEKFVIIRYLSASLSHTLNKNKQNWATYTKEDPQI